MSKSDYLILVGPPNSGKTTLFNWITGYRRQTVNYPGSTVDLSFGLVRKKNCSWKVVDTPGIYSFLSASSEGEVTQKILKDSVDNNELKGIVLVLDATRLRRQLPFFFQLKEAGLPVILALSMYDLQKKESPLDLTLLSKKLDAPVCPIEGLLGGGVPELLELAQNQFAKPSLSSPVFSAVWSEKKQENYLQQAKSLVDQVLIKKTKKQIGKKTHWLDSWFLHPVFGFGFLALILFSFFSGIFWLAQPLMDFIDNGFSYGVESVLKYGQNNLILDFLANGVLTSFGAFLVFVPQVFSLFLGI